MPSASSPSSLIPVESSNATLSAVPPLLFSKEEAPVSPRVLFVATSDGKGGIERYSVRLAALLRARGVAVSYACRPGSFLESLCAQYGVPSFPWQVKNSGDMSAAYAMEQLVTGSKIDIVHIHSRRDYVPALIGARLARHRRVLLHAHLVRPLGDPPSLAGLFFRWGADRVIAVSETVRERLIKEHGFPEKFVPLLPNGVDVAAFESADGTAQRQAWGIPQEALVIGMMGRVDAKGQSFLLGIAPRLLSHFPSLRFVMAGPDGSGGGRAHLLETAQKLDISDRLIAPGSVDDVASAMSAFDLLAHLPADESFGLAPAEAMAARRPVVATNVGGCREVIRDGITGFLVPLGDPDALFERLRCLLEDPAGPLRRQLMGEAGRQRVLKEFSLDQQVERLHDLYLHILQDHSLPS
jgi:glycosyltransferase involved in cell wall biosynthesis